MPRTDPEWRLPRRLHPQSQSNIFRAPPVVVGALLLGAEMAENANTIWADGPSGSPYMPDKALIREWGTRLENAVPTTLAPGDDLEAIFAAASTGFFIIPPGDYEFSAPLTIPAGSRLQVADGAFFIPTFLPTGAARATPLITLGQGVSANRLVMRLPSGINTIRKGFLLSSYCQVDYIEMTSADLNNNRTEAGETDLISGAVLVNGDHIRVGQMFISRFDRGWAVIDSNDVIIGKIRNLETLMGGYVHGSRDLHVLAGYTTGPANPTEPNSFNRGIMTPGLNSVCLAGCAESSFSNWFAADILEHAVRVGAIAAGTTVPNSNVTFNNLRLIRPYGCGFKMDDADAFAIKRITVNGLYTEDVGHDNWFGNPGYQNWSSGGVNNPANNNDGNKVACAIRNSQFVTVQGFMNRRNLYGNSGQIGFWIERSNGVQAANLDTEYAKTHGVIVQSGGTTDCERIEIRGVATRNNGGAGLRFDATANSTSIWRGVVVSGLDSQLNTGYGVEVTVRQDGLSPYATIKSRISGLVMGNTAGSINIDAAVLADPDFIDDTEEEGTFTPSFSFATPGNLSKSSESASGVWKRKGRRVFVEGSYSGTITHTTASGNIQIGGLPFNAAGNVGDINLQSIGSLSSWNSRTMLALNPVAANSFMEIRGLASAAGNSPMQTGNVTTGATFSLSFAGEYRI